MHVGYDIYWDTGFTLEIRAAGAAAPALDPY